MKHKISVTVNGRRREDEPMDDGHGTGWSARGKRVVITGATNGIGLAAAEELARRGAEMTIVARSEERARSAAARIGAAGGTEVDVLLADLASQSSVRALAAQATTESLLGSEWPVMLPMSVVPRGCGCSAVWLSRRSRGVRCRSRRRRRRFGRGRAARVWRGCG